MFTSSSASHSFLLTLSVSRCKSFPLTGVTFHLTYFPHFIHPFPYQRTCRLLPILCHFKHCCSEHLCTWLEQKLHGQLKLRMSSTSATHSLCDFKPQFHHLFKTRRGAGITGTLPYRPLTRDCMLEECSSHLPSSLLQPQASQSLAQSKCPISMSSTKGML